MTREKAIEYLKSADVTVGREIKTKTAEALEMAIQALEERKTGRWIEVLFVGNDNYDWECSECGFKDTHSKDVEVPFCWHCGAEMEGAEE